MTGVIKFILFIDGILGAVLDYVCLEDDREGYRLWRIL